MPTYFHPKYQGLIIFLLTMSYNDYEFILEYVNIPEMAYTYV